MNSKSHQKIQITSNRKYHVFKELMNVYPPTDERGQRLHLILTKVLQKSRHYLSAMRQDPYIYFSQKEALLLGGRHHYKENFQLLIDLGLLKPIIIYTFRHRMQRLMTFEPITLNPMLHDESITHIRINTSLEGYYRARKEEMVDVVRRFLIPSLRKVRIDVTEEYFFTHVSKNHLAYIQEFYEDHGNENKKPLSYEAYMESNRFLFLKLKDFNNAKGEEIYSFITQDRFSGRIHTPITVLPKYLKILDIIKYEGESMTELDIKTFQPMLLAIILSDSDYSKWYYSVDDCYVALQELFSLPTRNSAKKFMYSLMFGTTYGRGHKEFCARFPQAGEILTKWKTTMNSENPKSYKFTKKGNRRSNYHSNVAFLMQREEVKYMQMIWGLLGRKNIPFVTIHDAVLVPASKADLAEKLITEKFLIWFNGTAKLRKTDLRILQNALAA